jgi:hypothetical protein
VYFGSSFDEVKNEQQLSEGKVQATLLSIHSHYVEETS